ncbi:uncharacterized protein LOC116166987 [Photinus pyralis]|uniref:uncharacterized protein LOC116166987 n=1 Tax=Photinus pyralis TaxID=7054 RepID=UPI0012676D78|nr:uncharacterized protein LOC116166987 [Photinus pyralis]
MPKVKNTQKYVKNYTEEYVAKAIEEIHKGMSKKKASVIFNVPRATIQFRLSNKFKKPAHGPRPVLSADAEESLVKWILECQRKGFPRRKTDIQLSVKNYLDNLGITVPLFKQNMPGEKWFQAFLGRHKELRMRTSEAVTNASSQIAFSDIKGWFTQLGKYLKSRGYDDILEDPSRIFNGDETAFMFCPKQEKVVAQKGSKDVYEVDAASSKSNLTVMFSFCADGRVTPPMIIYPYKRMPKSIVDTVPKGWGIGNGDNGWMKSEVFYEYIGNVFYKSVVEMNVIFPIILFVDGHKTHLTFQLSELCTRLGIILIALYLNATRILQPADVAAFRPVKSAWKDALLEWRFNPMKQFGKLDFASVYIPNFETP